MEKFEEDIIKECKLRGRRENTWNAYIRAMRSFLKFYSGKNPEELGIEEIKNFLFHLAETKKVTGVTINRIAAGIKFYYLKCLGRDWPPHRFPRHKEVSVIPVVLSKEEVSKMIHATRNIKHKAIIMTLYSTGIRMTELRNLAPGDIDSKRMVINIREGKGGKDRQAMLSMELLLFLRTYWKENKDNKTEFLFPSSSLRGKWRRTGKSLRMSHTTVDYVVKHAAERAGIKKKSRLTL